MDFSQKAMAAPASLRRSWMARSACAALCLINISMAHADADLPDAWKAAQSELPAKLVKLAAPKCLAASGTADTSKWDVAKKALDKSNVLYLVQCMSAASNDIHLAVIQDNQGEFHFAKLYDHQPMVFNVRFSPDQKTMIDVSQGGASCVSERDWTWKGSRFVLIEKSTQGCKG